MNYNTTLKYFIIQIKIMMNLLSLESPEIGLKLSHFTSHESNLFQGIDGLKGDPGPPGDPVR